MLAQCLFAAAETVRMPDVILIGQRDQGAAAGMDGLLKVANGSKPLRVAMNMYGEAGLRGKLFQQLDTVVGGTIVEGMKLVRKPRLRKNAVQLREQKARAVEGAERDRDALCALTGRAQAVSLLMRVEVSRSASFRSPGLSAKRHATTAVTTMQSPERSGVSEALAGARRFAASSVAAGSSTIAGRAMLLMTS